MFYDGVRVIKYPSKYVVVVKKSLLYHADLRDNDHREYVDGK